MKLRADNIQKIYGNRKVVKGISLEVEQGEIIGLLGPNGAGKTTSFYMIVGMVKPNFGHIYLEDEEITDDAMYKRAQKGIGYLAQEASIFRKLSVEDNIMSVLEFTDRSKAERKQRLEELIDEFSLDHVRKNRGDLLSGGERNRLHLAMTLKTEANVLLLDEPTNDLDVNTLRALEEGILNFAGCAVIISHDRWFLERICTHILAFENDSSVYYFEGTYQEYEENKIKRLGNTVPTRVKYKKLLR